MGHEGTNNKGQTVAALPGPCRKLRVGKLRWCSLVANIMNDVDFLREHNIMDYSLLLGVATLPTELRRHAKGGLNEATSAETAAAAHYLHSDRHTEWQCDYGGLRARDDFEVEQDTIYYLGIVDILQEFNMKKRLEGAYKTRMQVLAGKDPTLISAVDSSVYAQRFIDFATTGDFPCSRGKG